MRTTITLDDQLLAQLKRRASESGTSVSKLIEHAVRLFVRAPRPAATAEPFEFVTFGAGGRFSRQNIDKTSALLEAEDLERFASRK
jgi:predicted transcriptional regulator